MLELSLAEKCVFAAALLTYLLSTIAAVRQLSKKGNRSRRMLHTMVAIGLLFELSILVIRAISIKAIPMTGLFESMVVITLIFGLTFLFLSSVIRQVWFSSVMVWIISAMAVLSATVATPASKPIAIAQTPWAILHGSLMLFSVVSLAIACAGAMLFLLSRRSLKQKRIMRLLGKMPNIEKLERINLLALKTSFIFMTCGLISGFVVAAVQSDSLGIEVYQWFFDAKIVLMSVSWMLVGSIFILRSVFAMKSRAVAQITIIAFLLILFAVVGTAVFCGTAHDFSGDKTETVEKLNK